MLDAYSNSEKKAVIEAEDSHAMVLLLFDELIKTCIDSNKDIIIESNGEHINSIIGWYQKTEDKEEVIADSHDKDHCKTPSLDLRDKINEKKYEKHVYFLYRPVYKIKESMISRAFKNMNNFLKNKEDNNIPRLPEIDDKILDEKIQKICKVYNEIKNEPSTINSVYVYYNNENQFEHIDYYYCEKCIFWEKYYDDSAKAHYYYNKDTGEAIWERPDGCCNKNENENVLSTCKENIDCSKISVINNIYDDNSRDTYFYNEITQEILREVPGCCCNDDSCTNGPCNNDGGRGKKRNKILKKYTQKKKRHRNYKAKKSRKKKTRKRNRKTRRH